MEEMAPLIYTPTVGQACAEFGIRFRRPRGMYFTPEDRGQMSASKSVQLHCQLKLRRQLYCIADQIGHL